MDRVKMVKYVFGSVLLLANKFQAWGDGQIEGLTMKQWFLLVFIIKMGKNNPTINEISKFTGTSRQNVKKMIEQLEEKKFVSVKRSKKDARALNVTILKKTYDFFAVNEGKSSQISINLFSEITDEELCFTVKTFDKLHAFFGNPGFDVFIGGKNE